MFFTIANYYRRDTESALKRYEKKRRDGKLGMSDSGEEQRGEMGSGKWRFEDSGVGIGRLWKVELCERERLVLQK